MVPTPLPDEAVPLFTSSEVEWTDLPVREPDSLEDFVVPAVLPAGKSVPPRGANMSIGYALLWCLALLFAGQLLPAAAMMAISVGLHFEELRAAVQDPAQLRAVVFNIVESRSFQIPLMVLAQLSVTAFALIVLRWRLGADWKRMIALRRPQWDHVALVLVGMPALLVVSIGVDEAISKIVPDYFGEDMRDFLRRTATWPWGLAVLCIGVGPAIGEELFCRGFLGRGLVGRYGYIAGVLLTSVLFGLIHLVPRQAIGAGILGLVLHFSYLASRSILVPMLIHLFNNGLIVLALSETMNVPLVTSLEVTYDRVGLLFLFAAGMAVALVGLAMYQSRFRRVSLNGSLLTDSAEIPLTGTGVQLVREPIPPGTVVLVVMALSAFAAIWWTM